MAMPDMAAGGAASPAATTAAGAPPSAVSPQNQAKIPEAQAGYMELAGAEKDGDCSKVAIPEGVSLDRGCCNYFEPQDENTDTFSCGNCKYGSEMQSDQNNAATAPDQGMAANHPLQQLRAKPKGMMRP